MHSKILPRPLPVFPLPPHSSRTDVKTIAVGCSHGMITINSPTPPYTLCVNSKETQTSVHFPSFRVQRESAKLRFGETFFGDFGLTGDGEKPEIIYPEYRYFLNVSRSFQSSFPPLNPLLNSPSTIFR